MSKQDNLVILQARMSSRRLPGKVLLPLNGKPMIYRQIKRILRAKQIGTLVVATSEHPSDDPLVEYLNSIGIESYRGSLDNVFSRFSQIIVGKSPLNIVRLTADCPLVMPEILDAMLEQFWIGDVEYMSNALIPTFPDGLDIEIFTRNCFDKLTTLELSPEELEHVTLGINNRKGSFQVFNFSDSEDRSQLRWTVDYLEDFNFVQDVYAHFTGLEETFTYQDVLDFLVENPEKMSKISGNRRNESLKKPSTRYD